MPNPAARIVIIEDEQLVAEALKVWLTTQSDCTLVGYARSADEGRTLCRTTRPDLVLLDIELGGADGLDLAEELIEELPKTRILMMSGMTDPHTIWRVWQVGVHGYIHKVESLNALADAIRTVMRGERFFSPVFHQVKEQWLSQPDSFQKVLSEREQEVLRRVVNGWEDERIGKKMSISADTVAFHRKNIRKKLDLHSDRELVAYGRRWGLC